MGSSQWIGKAKQIATKFSQWGNNSDFYAAIVPSSVFINILALAFPLVLLQIYDRIIPNNAITTLTILVSIVCLALLFEVILRIARAYIISWSDAKTEFKKSCDAYNKVLNCRWGDFNKEAPGVHFERLSSLNQLKDFYGGQALMAMIDMPFILIYLGLIAYIAGPLVLVPVCMLLIFICVSLYFGKHLRQSLDERRVFDERRLSFIVEVLQGIFTIKALAMEALITRRYERLQQQSALWDHNLSVKSSGIAAATALITQTNMIMIVGIGSILVISSGLSVGGLAACTILANRCLFPLGSIMNVWKRWQSIALAEERIEKVMELPQETVAAHVTPNNIQGKIDFTNVAIKHRDNNSMLIENINLHIQPNECVALTSAGMSGKSTVLRLLLGIEKPAQGTITIDDVPLENYNLSKLRQQIAYIPQDATLFNGTILENLCFFRGPEVIPQVLEMSKQLGLHNHIQHLPLGYDTIVGNQTVEFIPNGLRQQMLICRELAFETPIILFDEANNALDFKADKYLMQALEQIKTHSTIIMISHRPSTLKLADRTYQLKNNTLTELLDGERQFSNSNQQRN